MRAHMTSPPLGAPLRVLEFRCHRALFASRSISTCCQCNPRLCQMVGWNLTRERWCQRHLPVSGMVKPSGSEACVEHLSGPWSRLALHLMPWLVWSAAGLASAPVASAGAMVLVWSVGVKGVKTFMMWYSNSTTLSKQSTRNSRVRGPSSTTRGSLAMRLEHHMLRHMCRII